MVTGSFDVGNSIMFLRMSWAIKDLPRSDACHIGWLAMMSRFIETRILRILIKVTALLMQCFEFGWLNLSHLTLRISGHACRKRQVTLNSDVALMPSSSGWCMKLQRWRSHRSRSHTTKSSSEQEVPPTHTAPSRTSGVPARKCMALLLLTGETRRLSSPQFPQVHYLFTA